MSSYILCLYIVFVFHVELNLHHISSFYLLTFLSSFLIHRSCANARMCVYIKYNVYSVPYTYVYILSLLFARARTCVC